jgi:hypothetical protein
MRTINESTTKQACGELRLDELQAVEGGSPTLPLPPPSAPEQVALCCQPFLNHGYFYTVKADPSLINGGY